VYEKQHDMFLLPIQLSLICITTLKFTSISSICELHFVHDISPLVYMYLNSSALCAVQTLCTAYILEIADIFPIWLMVIVEGMHLAEYKKVLGELRHYCHDLTTVAWIVTADIYTASHKNIHAVFCENFDRCGLVFNIFVTSAFWDICRGR